MTLAVTETQAVDESRVNVAKPRLGFLGVGWIGRNRLEAIARSGIADIAAIVEPSDEMADAACTVAKGATVLNSYEELLKADLDGVVIATPSALHAEQSIAALERGVAVFCQKPLARTAEETRRVVDAARAADRLLSVDFSYRFISGVAEIREAVQRGEFGDVFAADLVFHNAYGPDKSWFFDPELSGGGCVMDLGVHLIDLAAWVLDLEDADVVSSQMFSRGQTGFDYARQVEDYAAVQLETSDSISIRLACSWHLNAGRDAVIEAAFYGTQGGAALRNVDGSFFDFKVEKYHGTAAEELSGNGGNSLNWEWGGKAAVEWVHKLSAGARFDPACERLVDVAKIVDSIYGRSSRIAD